MRTVAEIESAIEKLPTEQMLAVAAWWDGHRAMIQASEGIFSPQDNADGGMAVTRHRDTGLPVSVGRRPITAEEVDKLLSATA
jgi:hypothetical protein